LANVTSANSRIGDGEQAVTYDGAREFVFVGETLDLNSALLWREIRNRYYLAQT